MRMLWTTAAALVVTTPFVVNHVLIGGGAFKHGIPHFLAGSLSTWQKHGAITGNQATVTGFIANVTIFLRSRKLINALDLTAQGWNSNESGICTSVASSKVLGERGRAPP